MTTWSNEPALILGYSKFKVNTRLLWSYFWSIEGFDCLCCRYMVESKRIPEDFSINFCPVEVGSGEWRPQNQLRQVAQERPTDRAWEFINSGFVRIFFNVLHNTRISQIGKYRPPCHSPASLGGREISCTELISRALNLREKWRRSHMKRCHLSARGDDKNVMWICGSG